ncbi:hypothetical protein H4683_003871 [Filibacter limicola]|uniref:Uncharacterized protein n=1 Tax=Sporosarcina limicola TaxID=34101 RepID=A0A927ML59_9BACL|nr:hypothetical protein [Sporosarcina limicola]
MKKVIIVPSFLLLFLMSASVTHAEPDYYQPAKGLKKNS